MSLQVIQVLLREDPNTLIQPVVEHLAAELPGFDHAKVIIRQSFV
jgi:hypothetical protein